MDGISFSGLASGLDSSAIIESLVALERLPIQLLEAKKEVQQEKLSLVGTLKGNLETLKEKAENISTLSGFLNFDVSASLEGVADFTTTGSAQAGSHTLTVLQVATADRYAFDGVTDPNADLSAADGEAISFTVNSTNYQINLTQAGSSLNEIASAINELASDDVTASVVNTGTEASPEYQLVLSSNNTGEDFRITNINNNVAGLSIDTTPPDANGVSQSPNHISVGNNAIAEIDGLTVERSTNDFNGVVEGVTISALAADPGTTINFTVSANSEGVKTGVKELVDAYNEIVDFINQQNTFTEGEGAQGALFGDGLLRSVRGALSNALFNIDPSVVQADTAGFSTLSLVGIDVGNDGRLTINDSEFDEKLEENLNALADLFVDTDGFDNGGATPGTPESLVDVSADSGLVARLIREIEGLIDNSSNSENETVTSIFNARTDAINSQISLFDDQIESKEFFLEQFENNLIRRYAALEELMGQLNAQGASLSALSTPQ